MQCVRVFREQGLAMWIQKDTVPDFFQAYSFVSLISSDRSLTANLPHLFLLLKGDERCYPLTTGPHRTHIVRNSAQAVRLRKP